MFLHCKDPLPLSEACLQVLLPSLNAPVAQIEQLPNGPVRAAIVVYAEEYGDFGLAIGMRALESGDSVLYKFREPIQDVGEIRGSLESALSFAEGLGFLFDDDMIDAAAGSGRQAALEHWNRLMGDEEVFAPRAPTEPPPPASNPGLPTADQALLPPAEDLLAAAEELDLSMVAGESVEARTVVSAPGRGMPHADATEELLLDDLMDEVGAEAEAELLFDSSDALTGAGVTVAVASGPQLDADEQAGVVPLSKFRAGPAAEAAVDVAPEDAEEPAEAVLREAPAARESPLLPAGVESPSVGAEEAEADGGGAALGRIAIRRQKGDAARALFARLLSSF